MSIVDDILLAHDKNLITVAILLDFTKAFDTISHEVLLALLHHIGLSAEAVRLFESYFNQRSQYVVVDGNNSNTKTIKHGVAQGSILGPLLYSIYTSKFHTVLKHCNYHFYADDTLLYFSFKPDDLNEAITNINSDLTLLVKEAEMHHLKINPSKCAVLVFGPERVSSIAKQVLNISIDDVTLPVEDSAKYLGVILDDRLKFDPHVKKVLQNSYSKLKLLYGSRHLFAPKVRSLLCQSLVLSNFSHCYQMYGSCINKSTQNRIQRLQNSCLRFIFSIRRRQHISHTLKLLSWLNMRDVWRLQTAVLIHKVIVTGKPSYLHRKIRYRADVHNVNVRRKDLICCPKFKLQLARHTFTYLCHSIYNNIPETYKNLSVVSFKRKFRTLLLSG